LPGTGPAQSDKAARDHPGKIPVCQTAVELIRNQAVTKTKHEYHIAHG